MGKGYAGLDAAAAGDGVASRATKMRPFARPPTRRRDRAMAEQRHAVRPSTPTEGAVYGAVVATVEPFSIEHIPSSERHGKSGQLFLLWFAANLTIADYA